MANICGAACGLIVCSALCCARPADAGSLAPSKPSEVVNLRSSGASGGCNAGDVRMDTLVNDDGTGALYTIPAGKVFVMTGVSYHVAGGGSLSSIVECVDHDNGVATFCFPATTDSTGVAGAYFTVPNLVFKSLPCFNSLGSFTPFVVGFLANDK